MNGKCLSIILSTTLVAFLLYPEANGSPIEFAGKPPNCPYGKCFIDRCRRICSCVPKEGSISCTREVNFFKHPLDCGEVSRDGERDKPKYPKHCPHGLTYKDPLWQDNFECFCNNDASQTYECFDKSKQTSADYRELLKSIKSSVVYQSNLLAKLAEKQN